MGTGACNNILYSLSSKYLLISGQSRHCSRLFCAILLFQKSASSSYCRLRCKATMAEGVEMREKTVEHNPRFKWVKIGADLTEEQNEAISRLPFKMSNRCKAVMKQIICFSPERGSLNDLLATWVRRMKPVRADWLAVLRELKNSDHPFYVEVAEFALSDESFEANVRDYTKIIHFHGKQNRVKDAEKTLLAMKNRGFVCDQVILTALVDMYSKTDNLKMAEETFQEIRLLGQPLDKRSYGSMIMAYVRAGLPLPGEILLREMDSQEIYPGREVYKALLRVYSMAGDTDGAQRVFDQIQIAGFPPDVRHCGLLINAYRLAGQSQNARIAFENMRMAGLDSDDKCVALVLAAYEDEARLNEALEFLVELEKEGTLIGKEASMILAAWFRKLGVVNEVEMVLREFATSDSRHSLSPS